MTYRLRRYYGNQHLHFINCSCYRRQPWLGSRSRRDRFLKVLEEVRQRYGFVVVGYIVIPEHFHLLMSEPDQGTPSTVMQVLKQRFAHQVLKQKRQSRSAVQLALWAEKEEHVWQRRFYDFNVWSEHKRIEKLRYMHRNPGPPASPVLACWGGKPVKRGLVLEPEQWAWSTFGWYASGEEGPVEVTQWEAAELKITTAA